MGGELAREEAKVIFFYFFEIRQESTRWRDKSGVIFMFFFFFKRWHRYTSVRKMGRRWLLGRLGTSELDAVMGQVCFCSIDKAGVIPMHTW